MVWLELTLTLRPAERDAAEAALEALGALAITLRDADADSADEEAILEPGVGETPLWKRIHLAALLQPDAPREQVLLGLAGALPGLQPAAVGFREIADQDWTRAWMDRFHPMRFGRRTWVYPWTVEPEDPAGKAIVRLDPGLAFGTGTHPTTALCLAWLDGLDLAGRHLIDYGCGSGVLAIAALKLGAAHATGIDNDPQALIASGENAARNGVADRLELQLPDAPLPAPADVFVANILAGPLLALAPRFAALCRPGAPLALSGILAGQEDELLEHYARWFTDLTATTQDDWIRISGRRR